MLAHIKNIYILQTNPSMCTHHFCTIIPSFKIFELADSPIAQPLKQMFWEKMQKKKKGFALRLDLDH